MIFISQTNHTNHKHNIFSTTCHGPDFACFSAVLTETKICVCYWYIYPRRPKLTGKILGQKTWIRSNDEKRMRRKRVVDIFEWVMFTAWKINMVHLQITHLERKNDLPNLYDYVPC